MTLTQKKNKQTSFDEKINKYKLRSINYIIQIHARLNEFCGISRLFCRSYCCPAFVRSVSSILFCFPLFSIKIYDRTSEVSVDLSMLN